MTDFPPPPLPLLAARGLAFSRNDEPVFGPLDFAVAAGEALLVQGGNGAGKTSLLRVLAGLLRADAGEIDDELAEWWEDFSLGDAEEREAMLEAARSREPARRSRGEAGGQRGAAAAPAAQGDVEQEDGGTPDAPRKRRRRRRKPGGAAGGSPQGGPAPQPE